MPLNKHYQKRLLSKRSGFFSHSQCLRTCACVCVCVYWYYLVYLLGIPNHWGTYFHRLPRTEKFHGFCPLACWSCGHLIPSLWNDCLLAIKCLLCRKQCIILDCHKKYESRYQDIKYDTVWCGSYFSFGSVRHDGKTELIFLDFNRLWFRFPGEFQNGRRRRVATYQPWRYFSYSYACTAKTIVQALCLKYRISLRTTFGAGSNEKNPCIRLLNKWCL